MNDAIAVVGSLGADPTVKSVNGDRVAEFRLACTARRKEGEEWVNGHTNWFSVEAWGRFAEHVSASLRKGDVVVVLGKLKVDQWESGDKRGTSVKIRAEHLGHSLRVGPTTRANRNEPSGGRVDPQGQHSSPDSFVDPHTYADGDGEQPDEASPWGDPVAALSLGT